MEGRKKCGRCRYLMTYGMFGLESCARWESAVNDENPANSCERYSEKDDDEEYCPSATMGDYSPSNPWDAPGMSIRDFI